MSLASIVKTTQTLRHRPLFYPTLCCAKEWGTPCLVWATITGRLGGPPASPEVAGATFGRGLIRQVSWSWIVCSFDFPVSSAFEAFPVKPSTLVIEIQVSALIDTSYNA
jgi:hypothetical protein